MFHEKTVSLQPTNYNYCAMKRLLLLIFTLLYICLAPAQTGLFLPSERFSSSLISTLCQDREGFLWVGTDYGLNRYDGYRFATFLHDDADTTSLVVNVIVKLFCDRDGQLWVGTNRGLDRFDAEKRCFVHYPFPGGIKPRVSTILQRRDGTLLFGTAGYGAFTLNKEGRLELFSKEEGGMYFSQFFEDNRGRLWKAGFDDRVMMRDGDKIQSFPSTVGIAQDIVQYGDEVLIVCQHGILSYRNGAMNLSDIDISTTGRKDIVFNSAIVNAAGDLYIGTRGQGIYRVTGNGHRHLEPVSYNAYGIDPHTIIISDALFDRSGNLWLGCLRRGLLMVPQRPLHFSSWSFEGQGIHLGAPVSAVCEGDGGITWCTVRGVGIYGFNAAGKVVAHPAAPESPEFIYRDRLKHYWVGTDNALYAYDPVTGAAQQKVAVECDRLNDITCDRNGVLYFSAFSRGFCIYDPATGQLRSHNFNEPDGKKGRLCNNWVMCLSNDRDGNIWMGTSSGVSCYDPKTDSFRSQGWNVILDGIVCFEVCELHTGTLPDGRKLDGAIAIGTEEGLYLYDREKRTVAPFPGAEQLRNKVVSYIVQSNDGDIWCSTSAGIWQYDLKTNTFIGHISGNGLTQKEYLYGVGMHTDGDVIYFGQNDGLTVFSPTRVKKQQTAVDAPQLVAFLVGGTPVSAATVLNGEQVTDRAVTESDRFTVSYLDHTITLAFSQLNFDYASNVNYQYRINRGQWLDNGEGSNTVTLSQLQPGTYHIDVRVAKGNDYSTEKSVTVVVTPPWYRSPLAYALYFLVAIALAVLAVMGYIRRTNRRLDEEKMKFLINATHDIRSPLTLIMSPLNNLKKKLSQSDVNADSDLDTIDRNAKRILDLVNQILDVRKIDKQQMHLHCQKTDLVAFTRGICKMFDYNAQEREIGFTVDCDGLDHLDVWLDRGQFDKVISNLLSNAFKYTAEQGQVTLRLSADTRNAVLQVIDNGVGLDEDSLRHIFDRFYQGGNARRLNIKGTGIGLNLCKMIVDMHHGTISAKNRTDGQRGSIFTVTLPLGFAHLAADEIERQDAAAAGIVTPAAAADASGLTPAASVSAATAPGASGSSSAAGSDTDASDAALASAAGATVPADSSAGTSSAQKPSGNRYRILLVDDDEEIGTYISNELGRYYRFHICHNGREGLKELLASVDGQRYDLVVSDVMMPEMDGFTMLRMIKTNINVSDIPVIMLTSMADVGNRLEGLERGADAFLAKPFNMEELRMNIDNLLRTRQRLKGKYSGAQQQADKIEAPDVKGNDELLMERIMKAINKNLSDSDFNVDMLTQEVGISRAQLHRKMKEMTGISTSEFLRNIRLEQAARLLREQKLNVTQVAYTVGFSNLAHFSTIFRKHFGVAPSEYADREPQDD